MTNDIYCDSCGKLLVEYSNVEQDQPSPTPTRAEWEADAPNPNNYNHWENWAIDAVNWIRSMPCVPKEETK